MRARPPTATEARAVDIAAELLTAEIASATVWFRLAGFLRAQRAERVSAHTRHNLHTLYLVRPHWKALTIALVAVLGETVTDVLEPWPIKVVVDNVLQSKGLPGWLGGVVTGIFGKEPYALVNFAVAAVASIAMVGAVSAYFEKYLTTSVSQWVAHDLRRTLYHHIQRLSLAEHDE